MIIKINSGVMGNIASTHELDRIPYGVKQELPVISVEKKSCYCSKKILSVDDEVFNQ